MAKIKFTNLVATNAETDEDPPIDNDPKKKIDLSNEDGSDFDGPIDDSYSAPLEIEEEEEKNIITKNENKNVIKTMT